MTNRAKQTPGRFFLGLAARLTELVPVMLKTLLGIGTNGLFTGRNYTDDWAHCQVIALRRSVISLIESTTVPGAKNPARPKGYPAFGKTPIG